MKDLIASDIEKLLSLDYRMLYNEKHRTRIGKLGMNLFTKDSARTAILHIGQTPRRLHTC